MNAKILIADDESDIVSMLGNFFESKGFRVLPAFNGAEALKQVEKQPDIILLDINMPGTDGLEVCKRIRDHISCPILFLTARILGKNGQSPGVPADDQRQRQKAV